MGGRPLPGGFPLPQRLQDYVVPRPAVLRLYNINDVVGCYHMRLYDNAAHDFFYFSD